MDEQGFAEWVAGCERALLRSAYLMTGDLHRAEDLVQEALLKVAVRWPRMRDGNPTAYARTIVVRDDLSWWRRRRETAIADLDRGELATLLDRQDLRPIASLPFGGELTQELGDGAVGVAGLTEDGIVLIRVAVPGPATGFRIVAWDAGTGDLSLVSSNPVARAVGFADRLVGGW